MKKFLAIFILIFAIIGFSFSFITLNLRNEIKAPKEKGHLAKLIPATIGSLHSVDMPLGETEAIAKAAKGILSLTEFMNRTYRDNDGNEFTLFISYWAEGKEALARATVHTPDRCWVTNGWKNINEKKQNADILSVNGKNLIPAYYREMTYDATGIPVKRNIWFWFIANGERYDYGDGDNIMPSIPKYIENTLTDAFSNSPESYFIRIDSVNDLRTLLDNADFIRLLDSLGNLILYPSEK